MFLRTCWEVSNELATLVLPQANAPGFVLRDLYHSTSCIVCHVLTTCPRSSLACNGEELALCPSQNKLCQGANTKAGRAVLQKVAFALGELEACDIQVRPRGLPYTVF